MPTTNPFRKTFKSPKKERKMPQKNSYRAYLKQQMCDLIDQTDLSDLQKHFMKSRWLDQLLWLEGRATKAQNWYYRLRLLTIVGGVIVPALVGVNMTDSQNLRDILGWMAFGISQVVAVSAAVEEFFQYGNRYRQYRSTAEMMKMEGWEFLQLSGPYENANSHTEIYTTFASRVEALIQQDVEGYISKIAKPKQDQASKGGENKTASSS